MTKGGVLSQGRGPKKKEMTSVREVKKAVVIGGTRKKGGTSEVFSELAVLVTEEREDGNPLTFLLRDSGPRSTAKPVRQNYGEGRVGDGRENKFLGVFGKAI